jgi:hypothetical protein
MLNNTSKYFDYWWMSANIWVASFQNFIYASSSLEDGLTFYEAVRDDGRRLSRPPSRKVVGRSSILGLAPSRYITFNLEAKSFGLADSFTTGMCLCW